MPCIAHEIDDSVFLSKCISASGVHPSCRMCFTVLFHCDHSTGDLSHPLSCAGGGVGPCGLIYRHQWRVIWVQPHCSPDFHQRGIFFIFLFQHNTGAGNGSISTTRYTETHLGSSPCNHGNRRILLVGSSQ